MHAYEYKSVHVPAIEGVSGLVKLLDLEPLNALGAEGWEAVAAVPAALDGYAYAVTDGVHVLLRRSTVTSAA